MADYHIVNSIKNFATNHVIPLLPNMDPIRDRVNTIAQNYMPSKVQMCAGGTGFTLLALMGNRTTRRGLLSTMGVLGQLSSLILTVFVIGLYTTYKTAEGTPL